MKTCSQCKTSKDLSLFFKNKHKPGGVNSTCKACYGPWVQKNRDSIRERASKNYHDHRDERRAWARDYAKKNRKEKLEKRRAYQLLNKDRIAKTRKARLSRAGVREKERQRGRERYWRNPGKFNKAKLLYRIPRRKELSQYSREYALKNPEKVRESVRKRWGARYKNDPVFALTMKCRHRVKEGLKRAGVKKSEKTIELIGCTYDFLRKHLESKWTDGMSWKNHSLMGWVADHIRPIISFDLTIKEERLKCFHWSNLQPLWCKANLDKGDKICTEAELEAYRNYPPPTP